MPTSQTGEVVPHVPVPVPTDGQLLESFVRRRDDAALAALVQRHAAMVWGVCRRLLDNYHDA